jgi:mersacidin/lichenicidin family type 2 lantibiotic
MLNQMIIRAWKNREFRQGLSAAELALLPDHPAGLIDLKDADLDLATGGEDCGGPLSTYGTWTSKGWRCK